MRLKQYINDKYIGIVEKKKPEALNIKDREVSSLLKELNVMLGRNKISNSVSFDIVDKFESPSNVLKGVDDSKLEKITRRWMALSEKLEQIKDQYKNNNK